MYPMIGAPPAPPGYDVNLEMITGCVLDNGRDSPYSEGFKPNFRATGGIVASLPSDDQKMAHLVRVSRLSGPVQWILTRRRFSSSNDPTTSR